MTTAHPDSGALLEARGVRMDYERRRDGQIVTAVEGLDLSVAEGEFVSIVGPSGCGKTTFLRIVDGQVRATGGEVLLDGRPIEEVRRDRAMVFQEPLLFPWFSVVRNVAYGLECQDVPLAEAARRAEPYIELVGLAKFKHHYPHELSGGMQQRANLARALTVNPRLLLMDEPFSALDAQTRELMQRELLRIWEEWKRTVLFVTHQIGEAVYLSDRVIVMSGAPGRVVADITVELPRPRPLEVKRTPRFQEYEDEIWHLIERQVVMNFEQSGGGEEGR
ncbi:MAG TPA: ABC transporter ATP-binding protein [Candidatus Limnocylindrales bacterium]|nr:ABC transporter ATP-binding protein [Candidatus Limnocylindrales bacterium]